MNMNTGATSLNGPPPGGVAPALNASLVGVWELASIDTEFRDDGTRRPAGLSVPSAYLMFTPLGRLLSMRSEERRVGKECRL